jgi:hypothetical protein
MVASGRDCDIESENLEYVSPGPHECLHLGDGDGRPVVPLIFLWV